MNHRASFVLAILGGAALFLLAPTGARTQAQPTYEVKAGDSMLSIAQAVRPQKATVNQAGVAMVRANMKAFQARDGLVTGSTLIVPEEATMLATSAAAAEREFSRMWRGEQHYKAGRALEKSHDMFFAFTSYVEGAKLGHGPAQLRLGQLYDNDFSGFVKHDLQESIRWYERARLNQVEIRKQPPRGQPRV